MAKWLQVKKKAKACLQKKATIPMSPLYHIAMAAKFKKESDFKYVQDALNYLACKAQAKLPFSDDDKEFLIEIYEAFSWGGWWLNYPEASLLAKHYVSMKGGTESNPLMVDPTIYKEAPIVIASMEAMKTYILELDEKKSNFSSLKCDNPGYTKTSYANKLRYMKYKSEGKVIEDGVLQAPQNNTRLKKTDNRFYLKALTVKTLNGFRTTWRVDSLYDFEPFGENNFYTDINLPSGFTLIIYDGLSEYMVKLGIAKPFWYRMEWTESWNRTK